MISRKRTVVVYGRGTDGTKGDFIVVRELLWKGYDVVWAVQNGNKSRESFLEMEELLESEGLYDHLRVLYLDSSGLQPYVGDDFNFKFDGSVPYAFIHMGLVFDEGLSKDDPVGHYLENVQNTLYTIRLYKDLGMKKYILNCAYDLTATKESSSFQSVYDSMMCVSGALGDEEVRRVVYSDVVEDLPYDYTDVDGKEKTDGCIIMGNDNTCIINIINNLERDPKDGIFRIDLNEEIYKNRLGSATKSNAARNYVFGPDLANLHIALLDRDFNSDIPNDLYIGVDATTKEVLDLMSSEGDLEYKFSPEGEVDEDKKIRIKSNIPEFLIKKEDLTTDLNKLIVDEDKE